MTRRFLQVLALATLVPFIAPAAVVAAPQSGKGATLSDKKPGETCEKLKRGTDAYKDCIAKQAHTDQTGKGKGQTKDVDSGKSPKKSP